MLPILRFGSFGLVSLVLVATAGTAEPDNVKVLMESKLAHSQKVLEALTHEDFDALAKHSQELSLLTQAASWQVLQTAEYKQHSLEFRRNADALTEHAKNKNLDGATLAYVELTVRCVNCHKHVRKVRMAKAEEFTPMDLRTAFARDR